LGAHHLEIFFQLSLPGCPRGELEKDDEEEEEKKKKKQERVKVF
jgi:hypothetical protein